MLFCITGIILSGCTKLGNEKEHVVERESIRIEVQETKDGTEKEIKEEENTSKESETKEKETKEKETKERAIEEKGSKETKTETLDESIFIGEYNDYVNDEPNLEIAKGENGTYIVQIGIFRLTSISDGVGELTNDGMVFTATDASGDPIHGIITVEENIATVTFTDSTWKYIKNGDSYQYSKSSDVPNVWEI